MNEERAAQFAPFASLRGFYGMIDEETELTQAAALHSENEPDEPLTTVQPTTDNVR